jgi:hypothetical protein
MFDIIYSIAIKFYKIKKNPLVWKAKRAYKWPEILIIIDYCLKFSEQYVSYIQDENKFNDI